MTQNDTNVYCLVGSFTYVANQSATHCSGAHCNERGNGNIAGDNSTLWQLLLCTIRLIGQRFHNNMGTCAFFLFSTPVKCVPFKHDEGAEYSTYQLYCPVAVGSTHNFIFQKFIKVRVCVTYIFSIKYYCCTAYS